MKIRKDWSASKYVLLDGKLTATRDTAELAVGSRLIASLVAEQYDRAIRTHVRGSLVDLGCGKAPLLGLYGQFATRTMTVDWPQSLHDSHYVDYQCDLNHNLPFDDGQFDTIILSDVLEHLVNPQRLCFEMARVLTPRGKVLLNVPFIYQVHERPHDYFRYTDEGLKHLLQTAGLTVVELVPIGGSVEVLTDIVAKHATRLPLIGKPISSSLQQAVLLFGRTGLGRRMTLRSSTAWPLGYFVVAVK